MEKSVKSYGQGRKPAEKFIAMIDKYQDFDAMKLPHTRVGNYYIPDLVPDKPEPVKTVSKYGSLRRTYLKQHRHDLWRELAGSGKLTAQEWMDKLLPRMMEAAGVTAELKAHDQIVW